MYLDNVSIRVCPVMPMITFSGIPFVIDRVIKVLRAVCDSKHSHFRFLIDAHNYFVSNSITDKSITSSLDNSNVFPLYIFTEAKSQTNIYQTVERTPNLNMEIIGQIARKLGLQFTNKKEQFPGTFAPIDIMDYIYAVLYCPAYRERYKEFLKIDFPRVPYPKDADTFWQLAKFGTELRQVHLLESLVVNKLVTRYPVTGNNNVEKVKYEDGKLWINEAQYFEGVPQIAWDFCIGGYQPAQKWLKDRKGRILNFEDILHYQKIIVALVETSRIMADIDKIAFE